MRELRIFGPPGCLDSNTELLVRRGKRNSGRAYTIEHLYYKFNRLPIPRRLGTNYPWRGVYPAMTLSLTNGTITYHTISQVVYSGKKEVWEVQTSCGKRIRVTHDHPFKVVDGFKKLYDLRIGDEILCRGLPGEKKVNGRNKNKKRRVVHSVPFHPYAINHFIGGKNYKRIAFARLVVEADMNNISVQTLIQLLRKFSIKTEKLKFLPSDMVVHHKDFNPKNDKLENLEVLSKRDHDKLHGAVNIINFKYFIPKPEILVSIEKIGVRETYDITMEAPFHNYVANGFIVHNTGKSTQLATHEIPNAVDKFGPDKVVVTSFTKTGAEEISNKKSLITGEAIPVDANHVGTLHALCYRQLNSPEIAETKKKEWNTLYPEYLMYGKDTGNLDEGGLDSEGGGDGDRLLGQLSLLRSKMISRERWTLDVAKFEQKWTKFKEESGYVDFTDMIQLGLEVMPYAPGRPDVIFVDEAQDLTPLQLALVRSWGGQAQWIVLCGDDEQAIFSFTGASPDAFLTPKIDDKYKRVLQQSYRVPRQVYNRAMGISAKISRKEPKLYHPRDFEGSVVETMANYKKAEEIVDIIKRDIANNKTVMYLASCAYMLDPVKVVLQEQGIAFHNPFRLTRGDWNPLAHGSSKRTTATDILVSFNEKGPDANFWTVQQFLKWVKHLKVGEDGLIRKKGKAGIKALQAAVDQNMEGLETTRYVLKDILSENAINHALSRDFSWFLSNLTVRKVSSFDFPLMVMQKGGIDALFERPKTIIGTIHSVKGAEADTVILAPDISRKAYYELQMTSDVVAKRDELYRLFYVGMTRAREKLVLLRHAKQGGKAYFVGL